MSEATTNGTPVERTTSGRFLKGHKGIGGRGKGSRNKLSEAFLTDLHKTWLKHGKKVLDKVAESHPETFLRVCATVLPKAMEIDGVLNVAHTSTLHIEARDFAEAYERCGQHIGAAMPQLIEGEIIEDDTEPEEQPA